MKSIRSILVASLLGGVSIYLVMTRAAETETFQTLEFATIRWDGPDNSQFIRPNGKVERLHDVFSRFPRPKNTDERAYYLTIAMNTVAKEGFEVVGFNPDTIIMKRAIPH